MGFILFSCFVDVLHMRDALLLLLGVTDRNYSPLACWKVKLIAAI
jgi:hypothetical protein